MNTRFVRTNVLLWKRLLLVCVVVMAGGTLTSLAQSLPDLLIDSGSDSQVRLSWADTPGVIVLEEADTLAPTGVWRPSPLLPTLLDGRFSVMVEITGFRQFFRLHRIETGGLPPDPTAIAPPVPQGVATLLAGATEFLYRGPNAIQTGVAAGTIEARRAAVVRGKVTKRDNTPLSGVTISILDHAEFGQTLSRADGMFDLAVNGGGLLTVNYEKTGFCAVQRQLSVPWQDYVSTPGVVMIPMDPLVTPVALGVNSPMQTHQGSMQTDADGSRKATLLFTPGTSASLVLADGSMQAVGSLNVRATEFTVGPNGPATMPGVLPPTSGYTYAVELSADEAMAQGATRVQFDRPVFTYVENFVGFPVGSAVPVGFYDRQKAAWVPSLNGRVIKILSITGGLADVDTDGDGNADTGEGITNGERQQLATLYAAAQTLWRVPVTHFTPWDYNWPYGPPNDATAPNGDVNGDQSLDGCCEIPANSIIECENQVLGESLAIVGTSHSLNYRSSRVPGRLADRTLNIKLSGASVPASLQSIQLHLTVAGQTLNQSFAAAPNQQTTFVWDGRDAYGRPVQGQHAVSATIEYIYPAVYKEAGAFAAAFAQFGGGTITGNRQLSTISISKQFSAVLGGLDVRTLGMGGWSLSLHHFYDPIGLALHTGDGQRRRAQTVSTIIDTVSKVSGSGSLESLAIGADGSLYFGVFEVNQSFVKRQTPDGAIATVAGGGNQLLGVPGLAVGPDGSLFTVDQLHHRVVRRLSNGSLAPVAGTGAQGFSGDGGPATQAQVAQPSGIAIAPDGTIYISESTRIRRVGPEGIITTVAGTGVFGFSGDGGPGVLAMLKPRGLALAPDGSLYIADTGNHRIRRLGTDGIVSTVAGTGVRDFNGDGGPAIAANIESPFSVVVTQDGTLIFDDINHSRVRAVSRDGIITTIAGTGTTSLDFNGDGRPALQTTLGGASVSFAEAPDGTLHFTDSSYGRIRRVTKPLPGFSVSDVAIVSEDGSLLYRFDSVGRHLRTLNALTGATLLEFGYGADGRLALVTEKTGGTDNVTTIQHDGAGNPTAIVGPFGQTTLLAVDANGFLSHLTNPAGEDIQFTSTTGGLLSTQTDPRGNTSTYLYDATGRLIHDADPIGGSQGLARTTTTNSFTVARTTALARTTTYELENLPGRIQKRTVTAPDGTQSQSTEAIDAATTHVTSSDGTTSDTTLGPDPRFAMQSPIAASFSLRLPGALQLTITNTMAAVLTNPADPLSLVSLTDTTTVAGHTTTNIYTAANRTIVSRTPAGRTHSITVDSFGRLVQGQIGNLDPYSVGYDTRGRLGTLSLGSGLNARSLSLSYNARGFVDTITDSSGRTAHLAHDGAGRVTSKTLPDGRVMSMGYDASGNLTSLIPPGRPAHTFAYSSRNELTNVVPPNVTGTGPTGYAYDLDKNLTTLTRPGSQTATIGYDTAGRPATLTLATNGVTAATDAFNYDGAGRIASMVSSNGVTIAYTYDGGLPTSEAWSGPVTGSVTRAYDASLRLASQSINGANTVTNSYDNDSLLTGAGSLVITRDPQHGLPTGTELGLVSDSFTYNGLGEATNYTASASGSPVFTSRISRDMLGRIAQKIETIGGVTNTFGYGYDTAGQLTNVTRNGTAVENYSYDANGNRTNATVSGVTVNATYDDQDRLTQYGSVTCAYTPAGELASRTGGGLTTTYQHDALGGSLGATLTDSTVISYVVDAQGRRIGKRVNGTFVQSFLYGDSLRVVAELDGAGVLVSQFVYAGGIVPAYAIKGGTAFRLITDAVGSVRLVINTVTGAIVQRLDYDSFGNVTLDTNPGFQPLSFAGGLYDPATSLVRFGARDYDAETGRWTAKDPIGFAGNDANLYRYSLNDPINKLDPTGLDIWDAITGFGEQMGEVQAVSGSAGTFGIVMLVDSAVRAGAARLGFDPGPSLSDQLFHYPRPYETVDRTSEDYADGIFAANCVGLATDLAVGGVRTVQGIGGALSRRLNASFEAGNAARKAAIAEAKAEAKQLARIEAERITVVKAQGGAGNVSRGRHPLGGINVGR